MAMTKITRNGQITLPAEARRSLRLNEGDYLEAEVVGKSIVLTPKALVDREEAWSRLMALVNKDKYIGPEPRPSPEEEEEWIAEVLNEPDPPHA